MFKNRKISNYILFPKVQMRFLLVTALTSLIAIMFALYEIYASFNYLKEIGQKMNLSSDSSYFKLLNIQEHMLYKNILISLIVSMLIGLFINLIITHRALGPFYRIKVFFSQYKKGSGHKIKFRQSDYMKDIEESINNSLD
jgi:hypothetical protein